MNPYYSDDWLTIYAGDCRDVLAGLPADSVDCVVTSPPYWGLRDYGHPEQLGLERTPEEYVANMVAVFREVRRVLKPSGTCWLNLGDSYAGSRAGAGDTSTDNKLNTRSRGVGVVSRRRDGAIIPRSDLAVLGLKPKDLVGIPWRVAFALQADGWYLRSDIVWSKPNPMPESVTDRPTKSHEYLFLLTKSARYYFDADSVAERITASTVARLSQPTLEQQAGSNRVPGKTNGAMKAVGRLTWEERKAAGARAGSHGVNQLEGSGTQRVVHGEGLSHTLGEPGKRNVRSVWTIATRPYADAHFAVFPPELPERCIKAGSPPDGVVLDPFGGSGTVGMVANRLSRRAILIDLNPDYLQQQLKRAAQTPLGLDVA